MTYHSKLTAERYIAVNNAIRAVFNCHENPSRGSGQSRVASLFNAAPHARAAYDMRISGQMVSGHKGIESYLSDVPKPFFLAELNKPNLDYLINLYGPDIMRANVISANLTETDHQPLVAGGACILETWATRLLDKPLLKSNPGLRREVLLVLLQNAPYYSHLTGTMLGGCNARYAVMYDETFPWFLTVHDLGVCPGVTKKEWNLGQAKDICRNFYDDIFLATQKRSQLVSAGSANILRMPFADLQLEEHGYLKSWFYEYSKSLPPELMEFVPKRYEENGFLGSHVRYTYVGPHILDIVKKRLSTNGVDLSAYDIHVRTKQDDHLTEGKRLNRILLQGRKEEDRGFLEKYSNVCDLAIYLWHMKNWNRHNNGFIGFTDLSFKGNIVHDTIHLSMGHNHNPKNEEELWDILNSPLRLHKRNVRQHLCYLDKYVEPAYIYEEIAFQIQNLEKTINKTKLKLEGLYLHCHHRKIIREILSEFGLMGMNGAGCIVARHVSDVEAGFTGGVEDLKHQFSRLEKRYGKRVVVANVDGASEYFNALQDDLSFDIEGDLLRISLRNAQKYCNLFHAIVGELANEIRDYESQAEIEHKRLTQLQVEDEQMIKQVQGISFHGIDLAWTKPELFPLKNNMVFGHAVQLSFDSNISQFILDAQHIEDSLIPIEEKRRQLINAMEKVLPLIKKYLSSMMEYADDECRDS